MDKCGDRGDLEKGCDNGGEEQLRANNAIHLADKLHAQLNRARSNVRAISVVVLQ